MESLGINNISLIKTKQISINIIFTAFLLGFGGISVLLQVWSIISKSDLSIKPYIFGKLLHGIIAAFYTFIALNIFPFFKFRFVKQNLKKHKLNYLEKTLLFSKN